MSLAAAFVEELRLEGATTRRVLERVPGDRLSWRPHPRSMSLGQLAGHIADMPEGVASLMERQTAEVPVVPLPEAASVSALLASLDRTIDRVAQRITEWGDHGLQAEWTLTAGGNVLMRLPRLAVIRSVILNHWYHHRGQLTVYLRLLEVPLPAVYGPSADENPFDGGAGFAET